MQNINDLQNYACLKMEIFLKQPRDIVEEIDDELSHYRGGDKLRGLDKDERYLIYYAMCFDILSRRTHDEIVDALLYSVKQKSDNPKQDYTLLFRLSELEFPAQIIIDVCVDILKGK